MFKHLRSSVVAASLLALSALAGLAPITADAGPVGVIQTINTLPGGTLVKFNITAATVVKSTTGTVMRIVPITVGSAGALVLNDNTATGGSNTAANELTSIPIASMTAGVPILIELPFANGLVVSAVPTGGAYDVSYF